MLQINMLIRCRQLCQVVELTIILLFVADRTVVEKPTVLHWSEVWWRKNAAAQTERTVQILLTEVVMDDFKISKLDRFRFDFLKKI